MVGKYTLVNPMIVGNLKMSVKAENSAIAAKEIYNMISPYFSAVQPKFVFTLQKKAKKQEGGGKGGKKDLFYHFRVKEVLNKGEVVYTISSYSGKVNTEHLNKTIDKVMHKVKNNNDLLSSETETNVVQQGGDKDSDTFDELLAELDEEDSLFKRKKNKVELVSPFYVPTLLNPIDYYWYSNIYYDIPYVVLPSFIQTINPRIIVDNPPIAVTLDLS
jgi:hypothetical protein